MLESFNNKYITLYISSKFDSLDKTKITFSESKGKLERPGKGLITSMGFKAKERPEKYKNVRYAIGNVSKKELSETIKEYKNLRDYLMRRRGPKMSLLTATFI